MAIRPGVEGKGVTTAKKVRRRQTRGLERSMRHEQEEYEYAALQTR